MRRAALGRRLAGRGDPWSVGRWEPRNPINGRGRQDKSADGRRAHVVVGLDFSTHRRSVPAGAFAVKLNDFNDPTARRRQFPRRVQP